MLSDVDRSDLELLRGVLELGAQELDDQTQSGSGASQLIMLGSESTVLISDGVVLTSHEVQHLRQRQEGEDEPGGFHLLRRSAIRHQANGHVRPLHGSHDEIPDPAVHHDEHVAALRFQRFIQAHPVSRQLAKGRLKKMAQRHFDAVDAFVDIPQRNTRPRQGVLEAILRIVQVQNKADI